MAKNIILKHEDELREAAEGNIDLRTNQKLYKKVYKHYKEQGLIMTGDSNADYTTVINRVYEDLYIR